MNTSTGINNKQPTQRKREREEEKERKKKYAINIRASTHALLNTYMYSSFLLAAHVKKRFGSQARMPINWNSLFMCFFLLSSYIVVTPLNARF